MPSEIDAIFITHAHRDHIQGAGVLSRKYDLPIYATEGTWTEMEPIIGPIKQHNKCYMTDNDKVEIGDLVIEAFPLSHDALAICTLGHWAPINANGNAHFDASMPIGSS